MNRLLIDSCIGHNSGVEKVYYLPTRKTIESEFEKADRVLRIYGIHYSVEPKERIENLEEAVKTYEQILDKIIKRYLQLKRDIGIK